MYLHQLWCWCEKVQALGSCGWKFLYSRNVVFKEVKPSPTVVHPKEDEKKSVVQLPPKTKKAKLENEQ